MDNKIGAHPAKEVLAAVLVSMLEDKVRGVVVEHKALAHRVMEDSMVNQDNIASQINMVHLDNKEHKGMEPMAQVELKELALKVSEDRVSNKEVNGEQVDNKEANGEVLVKVVLVLILEDKDHGEAVPKEQAPKDLEDHLEHKEQAPKGSVDQANNHGGQADSKEANGGH